MMVYAKTKDKAKLNRRRMEHKSKQVGFYNQIGKNDYKNEYGKAFEALDAHERRLKPSENQEKYKKHIESKDFNLEFLLKKLLKNWA